MKLAVLAASLSFFSLAVSASTIRQSDAMVRLLNSPASQGPRLFEAAAERVASDAKLGMPLQRFIMAVHPDLPPKYRLDEATRKEYLESSRPKIVALAEQRDNSLAWYLLALESDDLKLLERAADAGNVQAENAWGTYLLGKGEPEKAFGYFKSAAAKKDANGIFNLGMCYMQGVGGEPNEKLAFECFRSAADMGHPGAINNIGGCYRDGIVVEKNPELSATWFKKGADLGDMYGQLNYALALQHGEGVAVDEAMAAGLLKESAMQGCPEAMNVYGMCYFGGRGVARDPVLAVAWFRRSAVAGFPPAMENLSECYDRGVGVEKNSMTSTVWKMRARAAMGDEAAAEWLESVSVKDE
ncbi:MAG: sel1 repeat family protein [Kiritimatiellae bacterium]|nr:sel1 repeat family protein [Kiritimatiellia bacterium]